jgi:heme exporter protein A
VATGQVLVITGRNGSGKSTLLRLIAGLSRPNSGTVELLNGSEPLNEAARRRLTGYLAPDLSPYEELTPTENLEVMARIRGHSGDARALATDLLDSVGLRVNRSIPAGKLSTGQRQRVKMALALLSSPRLLLLDEPGSNLDQEGRAAVERFVHEAKERGPVVIATNDPEEIGLGEHRFHLERLAPARVGSS